jgi:hypothetical protein
MPVEDPENHCNILHMCSHCQDDKLHLGDSPVALAEMSVWLWEQSLELELERA